jgi:hypothetical protein
MRGAPVQLAAVGCVLDGFDEIVNVRQALLDGRIGVTTAVEYLNSAADALRTTLRCAGIGAEVSPDVEPFAERLEDAP